MADPRSIIEVLTKARDLIQEFGWCQGSSARDKEGNSVSVWAETAACFCMVGAVARVSCGEAPGFIVVNNLYLDTTSKLRQTLKTIPDKWNDREGRTIEEVIEVFNKTIEYVSKKS